MAAPRAWQRSLPIVHTLRTYRRSWVRDDVVAGLVLTALLVPAGMGYAEAAGLPAITGLYATMVPLIAYALIGPSRLLVLGPDSALVPLIAAVVLPLAAGSAAETVPLAAMLALMTCALCVAAGLARLGFLTELLSKPIRYGYLNGIAVIVLVSQVPRLLGFTVDADGFVEEVVGIAQGIMAGEVIPAAAIIGCTTLAIILISRRVAPKAPGILLAVVVATMVVTLTGLADEISVVGVVPQGLPSLAIPSVDMADLGLLLAGAMGIALVSFTDTSVLSRAYAARGGYRVDANQELVALGGANIATGLFSGFPISSSATRTSVAEAAGSRSQVTGMVGAATIAVILVLLPGLFHDLPTTALAAVVIAAALGLIEIDRVRELYHLRRIDFALSIAAFLAVALLGVLPGILVAVGLSLADFVRRAWRPHDAVLGRAEGLKGYHDVTSHDGVRQIPGLVLFRWDAPLFFANADLFRERVLDEAAAADPPARWVVAVSEPITDIDVTAADAIRELHGELAGPGVTLAFAEMKTPVKEWLRRYDLDELIGREHFFSTVGTAVKAYLAATGVGWVDWEDAAPRGSSGQGPSSRS